MATPTTAEELRDALQAGANVKPLADQIMQEIAPATEGLLDVGAGVYLVVWPGYEPLSNPDDHFRVLPVLP